VLVEQVQSSARVHQAPHARQMFRSVPTAAGRDAASRARVPSSLMGKRGSCLRGQGTGPTALAGARSAPRPGRRALPLHLMRWELISAHAKSRGGSCPPQTGPASPAVSAAQPRLPRGPQPARRAVAPQPGRSCLGKTRVSAALHQARLQSKQDRVLGADAAALPKKGGFVLRRPQGRGEAAAAWPLVPWVGGC